MKRLILQELLLSSRREKAAKSIQFHPRLTVMKGANGTGKSSVIKSIYWCFGAEPAVISKEWKSLDVCGALKFSIDKEPYTIVRHLSRFGLFDKDSRMIRSFTNVTHGLGPYLADLFDFGLLLTTREGEPQIPPPAYFLLPYYIDQDAGWKATWCSFGKLSQFPDWKKDVAEYHIGLYDNDYYQLKTELTSLKRGLEEPRHQEKSLQNAIEQVRMRLAGMPIDFDLKRFQREVNELVRIAEVLAKDEEEFRRKVSELSNQRVFLRQQSTIAKLVMKELEDDYKFASQQAREVECPLCGATYQNSLIEHFRIALDEDYCRNTLTETQRELDGIDDKLSSIHGKMVDVRERHAQVWELLESRRDALTLHEMIMGEARGQAVGAIQDQIDAVQKNIGILEARIALIREKISTYEDKERRRSFLDEFNSFLNRFAVALRIPAIGPVRSVASNLDLTGSDLPRAVLCYCFAVLHMIALHRQSVIPSVVIDSPNQQDQDINNLKIMLRFIRDFLPVDFQLVLGLVDPQGIDFTGDELVFTEDRQILDKKLFGTVGKEIDTMLDAMYQLNDEE